MGPMVKSHSEIGGYNVPSIRLYSKTGSSMRKGDTEGLKCGICSGILRDPVQLLTCGCRYCQSCIQDQIDAASGYVCECVRLLCLLLFVVVCCLCGLFCVYVPLFSLFIICSDTLTCKIDHEPFTEGDVSEKMGLMGGGTIV